jgi:hypothetical protein
VQGSHVLKLAGGGLLLELEEGAARVQWRRDDQHQPERAELGQWRAERVQHRRQRRVPERVDEVRRLVQDHQPVRPPPARARRAGDRLDQAAAGEHHAVGRLAQHLLREDRRGSQEPLHEPERHTGLLARGRDDADRELLTREQMPAKPRREHGRTPGRDQGGARRHPRASALADHDRAETLEVTVDQRDQPLLPRLELEADQLLGEIAQALPILQRQPASSSPRR